MALDLTKKVVAKIGSQRPRLQKHHPEVKTTERPPRKHYYTKQSDADEVEDIEEKSVSTNVAFISLNNAV